MGPPHDPRAIANLLLDVGDQYGCVITNLSLQKLLYFSHAKFLLEKQKPLVKGYFEAWRYGPVHPLVYESFRESGNQPLSSRAQARDPISRNARIIAPIGDPEIERLILEVVLTFGRLTPGRLVDITHAPNAPWDFIAKRAKESVALGMRIPNDVIVSRFKFHKVSVTAVPRSGEPDEDAPLA